MTTLAVELPAENRSYDIVVRAGLLGEAGKLIAGKLGARRCVVITDDLVAPLYLATVTESLKKNGHTVLAVVVVAAGEGSKTFAVLQDVLSQVLASGVDRRTAVIALGGGVVGDLAGCAASLALRGLDLVQIPTTLLAQVDSSVGGKNGINSAHGKNTVGTFYQPRLVLIDPETLDSLPVRQVLAGYAEVVKYGLIRDAAFFDWCEAHVERLIEGDVDIRATSIRKSCAHKAVIVAADEHEVGDRALLNLGHSFGHALETVLGYDTGVILHGEAVAIGTVMAFRLSVALGLCPVAVAARVEKHFVEAGLPVKPPPFAYDIATLMQCMMRDKKAENGTLTLVLAKNIGQAFVLHKVDPALVQKVWQEILL